MHSCEYLEIVKKNFSYRTTSVAASFILKLCTYDEKKCWHEWKYEILALIVVFLKPLHFNA